MQLSQCLAASLLLVAGSTLAIEKPMSIGVQGKVQRVPYKATHHEYTLAPYIGYDTDTWYFTGLEAGYYLKKDEVSTLKLRAWYLETRYKASEGRGAAMKRLKSRHDTVMAGASYQYMTDFGALRAELSADTFGHSNGFLASTSWVGRFGSEGFHFYPQLGIDWADANQSNYYYGVTGSEAARSGIRKHRVGQTFTPWLALGTDILVGDSVHLYLQPRINFLPSKVKGSPMVDRSSLVVVSGALVVKF